MTHHALRAELKAFYQSDQNIPAAKAFSEKIFAILDQKWNSSMSVMRQKMLQHEVITEHFSPILFPHCPFYFETGALVALSDGARRAKNGDFTHAAGWTFLKNQHRFEEQDPALWQRTKAQKQAQLYLICGQYNDTQQHFNFNHRPIFEGGLRSLYEKARLELKNAEGTDETEYLEATCAAMLLLKKAAGKFADKAKEMVQAETDADAKQNLLQIAETASRVPWEAPSNLYEALCTLAFMRKMLGTLEGIGPNTFGRLDVDLLPFYQRDLASGLLTKKRAYDLICQFLIVWDGHYDHDLPMVGYADHELENTYTVGGCDENGESVCNDLTKMLLRATREEGIIFPKIKCRYSKQSPKEYLDEINRSVKNGTSTVLFQNDDACIPAVERSGRSLREARDYFVSGCWGMASYGTEKFDHGSYVNLLKPFEFALHRKFDAMKQVQIDFECYDDARDFEEFYAITLKNSQKLIEARIDTTRRGGNIWHQVDALPIFSATMEGNIEKHQDFTRGFGKYADDYLLCFGLPNIVDSLMAIKSLVFDQKKYSLSQYLQAVRQNWENAEEIRMDAIRCSGWGDGEAESSALACRFNDDLFAYARSLAGSHGGKVHIGHLTYTEIRFWGEKTLATPDGRKNGDYFSQGLTPSRLKKIPSATSVINSLKALDCSTMAANNVVNIILPSNKVDLSVLEGFLRAAADSAMMSLQLNCVSKEVLLDAQKHPERYPNLIVRVCGFSAKFTSLSPEWQNEVLTRNFYE